VGSSPHGFVRSEQRTFPLAFGIRKRSAEAKKNGPDKGNIAARLVGPMAIVEKAKPDFKKMIENALKLE
jgi:hypothetical protein